MNPVDDYIERSTALAVNASGALFASIMSNGMLGHKDMLVEKRLLVDKAIEMLNRARQIGETT